MTIETMLEEIRVLSVEDRKRLIDLIVDTLPEEGSPSSETQRHSILELRGLGKEIWEGIDAQEYINQMRDEWDNPT